MERNKTAKESKDQIDYTEKIKNFQAMVDNYNEEIALNYLTKADWDEAKATQLYLNETRNNPSRYNVMEDPHYVQDIYPNTGRGQSRNYRGVSQNEENEMGATLLNQDTNIRTQQTQEQPGLFYRFVVRPLAYLGSFFCSRSRDTTEEENLIFAGLPEIVTNLNTFNTLIKTRIGLIVLYQTSDGEYFHNLVNEVKKQDYLMDILKVNYVIFPLLIDSVEGKRVISLIADHLLYPCVIFAFNRRENTSFNRSSVMDRLEGQVSLDVFRDSIIHNVESKENMTRGGNKLSANATLIQQQKQEIENLERMENEKKKKDIEDKLKIQREMEEKRRLEEEKEKLKLEKKKMLSEEPSETHPQATLIIFRYPDGNRRAERRFLKSERIEALYNFVDSLGKDIFTESESYDLIQPFPFKAYNNFEKTLEEEKLFPNAVIQIREL